MLTSVGAIFTLRKAMSSTYGFADTEEIENDYVVGTQRYSVILFGAPLSICQSEDGKVSTPVKS